MSVKIWNSEETSSGVVDTTDSGLSRSDWFSDRFIVVLELLIPEASATRVCPPVIRLWQFTCDDLTLERGMVGVAAEATLWLHPVRGEWAGSRRADSIRGTLTRNRRTVRVVVSKDDSGAERRQDHRRRVAVTIQQIRLHRSDSKHQTTTSCRTWGENLSPSW